MIDEMIFKETEEKILSFIDDENKVILSRITKDISDRDHKNMAGEFLDNYLVDYLILSIGGSYSSRGELLVYNDEELESVKRSLLKRKLFKICLYKKSTYGPGFKGLELDEDLYVCYLGPPAELGWNSYEALYFLSKLEGKYKILAIQLKQLNHKKKNKNKLEWGYFYGQEEDFFIADLGELFAVKKYVSPEDPLEIEDYES